LRLLRPAPRYGIHLISRRDVSAYYFTVKRRLIVAIVVLCAALLCLSGVALAVPHASFLQFNIFQQHSEPIPRLSTFTGTITRNGDRFVPNDASTHILYQLDDQETAGKFRDKKVKVAGTLDVVKNLIRIQSIAEAAA
jgi:hypothetical protein